MCDVVNIEYLKKHFDNLENINEVLEVGSCNINGNFKEFIEDKSLKYLGIDIKKDKDVDLILDITEDIDKITSALNGKKFDLIICANILEHLYEPIKALDNIVQLINLGGYLMIICPAVWDLHEWPNDFYRFNPDFFKKYCSNNKMKIIDDSFVFSERETRKFYKDIYNLPMIHPHIYNKGLINLNLRFLAKFFAPELRECYPHLYINLIVRKI